ncbi:MAG: response regulator [Acidobacteria bacterium]|nr:response regulator [Acidobacteriota bacterium]
MTIRLLVADDSVTIQKIVSLAFNGEDIVIKAVSDGDSAMEAVREMKPDLVLADVFMPGCSGYQVCERIKEDPATAGTPVVLLVGTFEPFDESEASRVKCDAFLTKPFDTSELIRTVHELVKKESMPNAAVDVEARSQEPGSRRESRMISGSVLESFVGKDRILDIIDPETVTPSAVVSNVSSLSDEQINLIVDRVIRKMSADAIREVAWEVVPELSESIIRSTLREQKN